MLRTTVSLSICFGDRTHLGPATNISSFKKISLDIYGLVDVGHSLYREVGSVVYNYCWASPAQSFSGLMITFYCLNLRDSPNLEATFLYLFYTGTVIPSKFEVTLRLTVSQSVCLGIEHPCGTCDQILLPVGILLSESCGLVSVRLTGERVCNLQCNHSMVRVAHNP
jgi:hypothetical protein